MNFKNSPLLALCATCLPLFPLAAASGAPDAAIVGADAQWMLYVDLNSLREGPLGKELIAAATKAHPKFSEADIQVDFQKLLATVGTITAYGTNFSQHPDQIDGTLVVQGTADFRKIAEGLVAQTELTHPQLITQLKDLPFEAYQISKDLVVGFPPEPIVLLSKSKAQIVKARDVMRGKAPSLAKSPKSPLAPFMKTSRSPYFVAASVMPSEKQLPDTGPHARILQMAKSGSLCIGDQENNTFVTVQLAASNDESADKLQKIVQGGTAMLSLAESNDRHLAEFLRSVKVERKNETIYLDLSYSSERLVQMLQNSIREEKPKVRVNVGNQNPSRDAGKLVAQWTCDLTTGEPSASAKGLTTRPIENVALQTGSIVTILGRRNDGENARLDYVEVVPQGGGAPLRFEAEHMRHNRYNIENAPYASGGRVIACNSNTGTAYFHFPASDGTYTLNVRYIDESDGQSTFSVNVKNPEPQTPAVEAK